MIVSFVGSIHRYPIDNRHTQVLISKLIATISSSLLLFLVLTFVPVTLSDIIDHLYLILSYDACYNQMSSYARDRGDAIRKRSYSSKWCMLSSFVGSSGRLDHCRKTVFALRVLVDVKCMRVRQVSRNKPYDSQHFKDIVLNRLCGYFP